MLTEHKPSLTLPDLSPSLALPGAAMSIWYINLHLLEKSSQQNFDLNDIFDIGPKCPLAKPVDIERQFVFRPDCPLAKPVHIVHKHVNRAPVCVSTLVPNGQNAC